MGMKCDPPLTPPTIEESDSVNFTPDWISLTIEIDSMARSILLEARFST
jgi:hypothetical protein